MSRDGKEEYFSVRLILLRVLNEGKEFEVVAAKSEFNNRITSICVSSLTAGEYAVISVIDYPDNSGIVDCVLGIYSEDFIIWKFAQKKKKGNVSDEFILDNLTASKPIVS